MRTPYSLRLALLAVLVASCAAPPPGGDRVGIVFSYGKGGEIKQRALDELIDGFHQRHPEIAVRRHELVGVTDIERSFYLSSLGAKSNFVDLFELDVIWNAEFAAGGLTRPLDGLAGAGQRGAFLPAVVRQLTYDGKLHAWPYYVTYSALFYRVDLLRKHRIELPRTVPQLLRAARTIARAEGIDGLLWQGKAYEGLTCNFFNFYYNLGGELSIEGGRIAFQRSQLEGTIKLMQDLIYDSHDGGVSPAAVLDHTEEDSVERFAAGKAAFMINWQSAALYVRRGTIGERFAIAPLPGRQIALVGGWHIALNARSRRAKEAIAFARHLTAGASQGALVVERGQGPVLERLYRAKLPGLAQLDAMRILRRRTRARPSSPYYYRFSRVVVEHLHRALSERTAPPAAARELVAAVEKIPLTPKTDDPQFPKQLINWNWY